MNADSLNIVVYYWYHPPEYWDYLEHATRINEQIIERFNAEGIDFAFPSQTLYHAGDDKRPLTFNQRWISDKENISPGAASAQAFASDLQAIQSNPSISQSVRSHSHGPDGITDATLENESMEDEDDR